MSGPVLWTLAEASTALAARRIGAAELARACLARIADWNPRTNAVLDLRAEDALAAAAASDARRTRGAALGPLDGIPLAHKDMFYRVGRISTCGSAIRRDWRAPVTATVLARLDAAGAVDLGTLNMAEWAGGATGHNIHFGDARNPWDPARVTGGSSAGTGAAVAARMIFGGLGSDTGGSIRLPAACCGITGHKPSWGLVSRHGAMPRAWTLDCIGPLARTAEDCALLLAALAGPDADDPSTDRAAPVAVPPPADPRGLTIGVDAALLDDAVPSVRAALDEALAEWRRQGARIVAVTVPDYPLLLELVSLVSTVEAASLHRGFMRDRPDDYAPDLFSRSEPGFHIPAVAYADALRLRGPLLRQTVAAVFAACDLLFTPTIPIEVPTRAGSEVRQAADFARVHLPMVRHTRPFNYLGSPVLSLPCGFDANGLPVGFQLAGRPGADAAVLAAGMAWQRATDWHAHCPPAGAGAAQRPIAGTDAAVI